MAQQVDTYVIPEKLSKQPAWACKISSEPADKKGFTVGEVFEFECEGMPVQFKDSLQVKLPENHHHTLQLLKPEEHSDSRVRYQATSYRAGEFKYEGGLVFVDEDGNGFVSQPFQITTASVIDPQNPPKEPFGPVAPLSMGWPFWLFLSIGIAAVVLVGWILIFSKRYTQKKNLEKNIKKFQSPMGSYHQFSKDMRALKRGVLFSSQQEWPESQVQDYVRELDDIYRMYVLREYVVPAREWTVNAIGRAVKRKDKRHFSAYGPLFYKAFKELERAKGNTSGLTARDCEQLTSICFQAVDAMWKSKMRRGA